MTASTKSVRRDRGNATKELVFIATIPPMGYTSYQVTATSSSKLYVFNILSYPKIKYKIQNRSVAVLCPSPSPRPNQSPSCLSPSPT